MGIGGGVHSRQAEQTKSEPKEKKRKLRIAREDTVWRGRGGAFVVLRSSLSWSCRVCFGFLYFAACHTSVLPAMFPAEGRAMLCISFGSLSYRLLRPPPGAASYKK